MKMKKIQMNILSYNIQTHNGTSIPRRLRFLRHSSLMPLNPYSMILLIQKTLLHLGVVHKIPNAFGKKLKPIAFIF